MIFDPFLTLGYVEMIKVFLHPIHAVPYCAQIRLWQKSWPSSFWIMPTHQLAQVCYPSVAEREQCWWLCCVLWPHPPSPGGGGEQGVMRPLRLGVTSITANTACFSDLIFVSIIAQRLPRQGKFIIIFPFLKFRHQNTM